MARKKRVVEKKVETKIDKVVSKAPRDRAEEIKRAAKESADIKRFGSVVVKKFGDECDKKFQFKGK